ncbi:hypothetical protein FCU45_08900 [Sulfurimonas crateris]|uniref:Uncharacterized protein n=1 Tax=Sulfurimonas crateris TaxID=2574727 RepID=A0A4U2Z4M7_9BACT|nr:hypothetical protein [Sulfurimonas crateris]TKI69069.1 hypothetical protein FCU45_08900 [Sulfurimonas crateris]
MDELIKRDDTNMPEPTVVALNNHMEIGILRGFEIDVKNTKKYMRNVLFIVGNEVITDNFADTILLKEELKLFDKGDEQNTFFKVVQRELNGKKVISLELSLDDGKKIYISKSEAKAIVDIWNMAMQGYSFARILEYENTQTLESWTDMLYQSNLLKLGK